LIDLETVGDVASEAVTLYESCNTKEKQQQQQHSKISIRLFCAMRLPARKPHCFEI
jgi:hypothetical protein